MGFEEVGCCRRSGPSPATRPRPTRVICICWAEHYEITRYGTLKQWATLLGYTDATRLLDETLQEESNTDESLTVLADAKAKAKAKANAKA